jgi:hypothetical protein
MRNILHEFGFPQHGASPLHIDNQSAISVSKNPEHFGRMKHLDLRFFWLCDVVEFGLVSSNCLISYRYLIVIISHDCVELI